MEYIRFNIADTDSVIYIESARIDAYVIRTNMIEIYFGNKKLENIEYNTNNIDLLTTALPPQLKPKVV